MKTDKIVEDVALLLGAPSSLSPGDESLCTAAFRRRILIEVEECVARAIAECDKDSLSGWRPLKSDGLKRLASGGYLLPLPDDFLLLHTVCMTHWDTPVGRVMPSDHWLLPLQMNGTAALRATPERPLVFMWVNDDGHRALRLFGGEEDDAGCAGWYFPYPKIDAAGEIDIPPAVYLTVVSRIAERMAATAPFT